MIFFIFLVSGAFFAEEMDYRDYQEKILVEDFESIKITNQLFNVQANTNYLPDVRMSKNLTSPDLISNTSLLVRITPEAIGIPMNLRFSKPYILNDYIEEFQFHIYSNQANGELSIFVLDTKFQEHKIPIANLNFDGWKNFRVPIANLVSQKDFVIGKPGFMKFIGIQFSLAKKNTKNKEDLIAIDDIFVIKRKKYRFPAQGLEAFK
jgi:hypothetical protein